MATKISCREVIRAAAFGMSQEVRDAWSQLDRHLKRGPVSLLGSPSPHSALLSRARCFGALEASIHDTSAPTRQVVIPMTGASVTMRREWKARGHEVVDLSLPSVRRLHAMKSLLIAEQRSIILVGFRGDPECEAMLADGGQVTVVENADEVARLPYSPRFGVLCQTGVSGRRYSTVVDTLRQRFRDSSIQPLDTRSAALIRREAAIESLTRQVELIVVLSHPGDISGRALYEDARWHGCAAVMLADGNDSLGEVPEYVRSVGISAGIHTPDDEVELLRSRLLE